MTPCSAYCLPDEGMHAYLDYLNPACGTPGSSVGDVEFIGEGDQWTSSCLPVESRVIVLSENLAEAPPHGELSDWFPVLIVVQVLP